MEAFFNRLSENLKKDDKWIAFIPISCSLFWNARVFVFIGNPMGVHHWKFYASLAGFLIILLYVVFLLYTLSKENPARD